MFHPTWIPESLDPSVDALKRVRVIAGAVAALGVYTFVEGGFAFTEMLDNAATASAVLFFVTPVTVGVMTLVRRSAGVPLSDAAASCSAAGAAGAVVSTVTASLPDAADVLPATSVARAWI